jgi:outer membrane protein assembly factor BamB
MIKGNLSSFSLGEIFQSLAVNNHTGTLKITEKDGREKFIYLSHGEICLFSDRAHPTLRVGEILVRQGRITRAQLESALEIQKVSNEKLGQIFLKQFALQPGDLQEALTQKIYDEIYDLFLLVEAEFEFFVDHLPEEIFDAYPDNIRLSINTTMVVMEGLRVADEWKLINKKIRSFNEIFVFNSPVNGAAFESPGDQALCSLIDGATPVRKIFERFPGSRFECCKSIFGFLNAGLVRPLTLDECREKGNQAAKTSKIERSLDFLMYAAELSPGRPETHALIGQLLLRLGRTKEGQTSLFHSIRQYHQEKQYEPVLKLGELLLADLDKEQDFLEAFFDAAVTLERVPAVEAGGTKLAAFYLSKGLKGQAAEVLLTISRFLPRDTDRKLHAANLLKEAGSVKSAIPILEEIAASFSGRAKLSEKVRILRYVLELAPERQDIKQEITNLLSQQQDWEKKKKRRFTIAGAAFIALLLLLLIPLLYEIKARELLSHAQRLEEISMISGNYTVAKSSYQRIIASYGFSTPAADAREAIERIRGIERSRSEAMEEEKAQQTKSQEERRLQMHNSLNRMLEAAQDHEKRGEYRQAFEVLKKISRDFPEIPRTKHILLPILITSSPAGCAVKIEGKDLGKTPLVVHRRSGEIVTVLLHRSGCESTQREIVIGDNWTEHFDVELRPLSRFSVSGPVHLPLHVAGGEVYFSSRDGYFYAVHAQDQSVEWRAQVGKFGDLTSKPCFVPGGVIVGTVRGEVILLALEDGTPRWKTPLKTTILAQPAVSNDLRWLAVGDLNGNVVVLDPSTGKAMGAFFAENEIIRGPKFWGNTLVVASEDNALYLLGMPAAKMLYSEFFLEDLDSELVISGNRLFLSTKQGNLLCYDLDQRGIEWKAAIGEAAACAPAKHRDAILVGTQKGKLRSFRAADGAFEWEASLSTGSVGSFLIDGNHVYLGTHQGEALAFDLAARKVEWLYRFEDAIVEMPILQQGRLYFVSSNGQFLVMESFN